MPQGTQSRFAKGKITRIQTFVKENPLDANVTTVQYETKLGMLEAAFQEFCLYHNESNKPLTGEMREENLQYYISVEKIYLQTSCTLKNYIAASRLDFNSGSVPSNFNPPYQIELEPPIFSEDYSEWDSLETNIYSFEKTSTTECPICTGQFHKLYHCQIFKEWNINSRKMFVNQHNYCSNCLLKTHPVTSCKSKYVCQECKQKHHTALHTSPASQIKCKHIKSEMINNFVQSKRSNSNQNYNSSPTSTSQTISKPKQTKKMSDNSGHINPQTFNQNYYSSSTTKTQPTQKMFHNPGKLIKSNSNKDYNLKSNPLQIISANTFNNNSQTANKDSWSSTSENNTSTHTLEKTVGMLSTTDINTLDAFEILQQVRILFDSSSQDSFSFEHCIQPQVQRENARNVSNGTNNSKGVFPGEVQLSRTRFNPDSKITLPPKIQLQISDTNINSSQLTKVDITIDTNHSMEILQPGFISTPAGHSIITNSLDDWIVSGSRNIPSNITPHSSIQNSHISYVAKYVQTDWGKVEVRSSMLETTLEETNNTQQSTHQILQDDHFLLFNRITEQHKLKFVNSPEKSFFYFQVYFPPVSTITSVIYGLDLFGYLKSAIIQVKLFQERLLQIKWNDDLPITLQIHWTTFVSALHKLEYIKSKRRDNQQQLFRLERFISIHHSRRNDHRKIRRPHIAFHSKLYLTTTTIFLSSIFNQTLSSKIHIIQCLKERTHQTKSRRHQVVFQHNSYNMATEGQLCFSTSTKNRVVFNPNT